MNNIRRLDVWVVVKVVEGLLLMKLGYIKVFQIDLMGTDGSNWGMVTVVVVAV